MGENKAKRYIFLIVGLLIIGVGIAVFVKANLGIDPFTLMNRGISRSSGINFSVVQWVVGFSILAIVFFVDRSKIFVGTILNMLMVAPVIEGVSWVLNRYVPVVESFAGNFFIACIGCGILCIGAGMYLGANLGLAPYDLIAIILAEKLPIPFKWMRMTTDAICVLIGWRIGEVVGVGTLIAVFCMGPLIDYTKRATESYLHCS